MILDTYPGLKLLDGTLWWIPPFRFTVEVDHHGKLAYRMEVELTGGNREFEEDRSAEWLSSFIDLVKLSILRSFHLHVLKYVWSYLVVMWELPSENLLLGRLWRSLRICFIPILKYIGLQANIISQHWCLTIDIIGRLLHKSGWSANLKRVVSESFSVADRISVI
jgi:hypothetical protein